MNKIPDRLTTEYIKSVCSLLNFNPIEAICLIASDETIAAKVRLDASVQLAKMIQPEIIQDENIMPLHLYLRRNK